MHVILVTATGEVVLEFTAPFVPETWDIVSTPDGKHWIVKGRELCMTEKRVDLNKVVDLRAPKQMEMYLVCTVEAFVQPSNGIKQ